MAHAAKLAELAGDLVTGITKYDRHAERFTSLRDEAIKGLKNATYARTNQFDVQSKLDGLVEKFAVLNRETLAEALQTRLEEAPAKSKWMPEILSLLLLLSDRPAEKTRLEDLDALVQSTEQIPTLTWDDIIAQDPLDEPGIWDDVERGYHSSGDDATVGEEDDDDTTSTKATSIGEEDFVALARLHIVPVDDEVLNDVQNSHDRLGRGHGNTSISELSTIRETLSMLHGLPSSIYEIDDSNGEVSFTQNFALNTATRPILNDILSRCADIGSSLNELRRWIRTEQEAFYLQSCQAAIQSILMNFTAKLAGVEQNLASPEKDMVISIIGVLTQIEVLAKPLLLLSRLVHRSTEEPNSAPFSLLDLLHDEACIAQMSGDAELFRTLTLVLFAGLKTYLKPASVWIRTGSLADFDKTFFVVEANPNCDLGRMWHERFTMRRLADSRPSTPNFMQAFADQILSLGKSRAFLLAINNNSNAELNVKNDGLPDFASLQARLETDTIRPFSQILSDALGSWIGEIGKDCSPLLRTTLLKDCGLLRALEGLVQVFCSADGIAFQIFADALFWRMSLSDQGWRDRFLLTELAQNTIGTAGSADAENLSMTIKGDDGTLPTSSIAQIDRIKLEYPFSLPNQNVTRAPSPETYSKAFTLHLQVYRAKYLLRRQATDVRGLDSATARLPYRLKTALKMRQSLLTVIDTLHTHISNTARTANTALLRDIESAVDIDSMVAIWGDHCRQMETDFLLAPNLKPIRDAVGSVLEICERFCDIWCALFAQTAPNFAEQDGSDEGGDHSPGARTRDQSSILPSLLSLQSQWDEMLSFIAAGLRGISRAGGSIALEALAERLQWKAN